ncbi:alpha/beta hydrolase family protein [Thermomonospora umbrina]|uniref:Poly(ethylene terephthalate) hydrolase n=1 Tax=Thermomonospora umbrina TaxID=111806 RepID=A0A3D9SUJ1_9ACTN|nr:alpha/beta hydrolase [Thermomonospora umbrina]REE97693.1 dienelactone hydrolase [Thermomonospora umbrina]
MGIDLIRRLRLLPVVAAMAGGIALAPMAEADDNPYQRGPEPTAASLEGVGPFATAKTAVPAGSGTGFNSGTIYYPTSTSEGTFGGIAVSPGFLGGELSIGWLGPRLASHGFVVMIINTKSRVDSPIMRGEQMLAALDYLTQQSSERHRVDATRLGVMGHSMGGGGAVEATDFRRTLKASVPLTPWNLNDVRPEITTPTLFIGSQNDLIAPVNQYSEPLYEGMPKAREKAYLELKGGNHFAPMSANPVISKYGVSWLKRFVDDDLRYDKFLCPAPEVGSVFSEVRSTCPND